MVQTTNKTDTKLNTLSIQVSLNGLSFCILDNSKSQVMSLSHENFGIQLTPKQALEKVKYAFDHNDQLKKSFDTIEVIYQNDLYTVVPKSLFKQELLSDYLKFNIKVLENDFIAYDELDQHDIVSVYIPYTNINNFFFESFGSFTYKHASSILINSLLIQEKNNKSTTVFANINEISFDIVVISKGNLILSNTFPYQTKEDFLYYLMYTTEQLKLNPEEFKLVFLGNLLKDSDFFKIAHKYIRNISFGNLLRNFKLAPNVGFFEPHQHFVLLSHF